MVIVIPYSERLNYLRLTLSTLKEALRGFEASILLYCTYEGREKGALEILKEMPSIVEHTHITRTPEKNIDYLIPTIINDVFDKVKDQYIVLLDSDTIVHPRAIEMFLHMQNSCLALGMGSLFNTSTHPFIEKNTNEEENAEFGIKKHLGGFGLLINREAWLKYCSNYFCSWDANSSSAISNSRDYDLFCSTTSYLEHVGMLGCHRHEGKDLGHPMSIDRALNFFN